MLLKVYTMEPNFQNINLNLDGITWYYLIFTNFLKVFWDEKGIVTKLKKYEDRRFVVPHIVNKILRRRSGIYVM